MKVQEPSKQAIIEGDCFVGYCGYTQSREWAKSVCGETPHEVFYTERNGDPITLVVPLGADRKLFPDFAKGYIVFKWERPECTCKEAPDDKCEHVTPSRFQREKLHG